MPGVGGDLMSHTDVTVVMRNETVPDYGHGRSAHGNSASLGLSFGLGFLMVALVVMVPLVIRAIRKKCKQPSTPLPQQQENTEDNNVTRNSHSSFWRREYPRFKWSSIKKKPMGKDNLAADSTYERPSRSRPALEDAMLGDSTCEYPSTRNIPIPANGYPPIYDRPRKVPVPVDNIPLYDRPPNIPVPVDDHSMYDRPRNVPVAVDDIPLYDSPPNVRIPVDDQPMYDRPRNVPVPVDDHSMYDRPPNVRIPVDDHSMYDHPSNVPVAEDDDEDPIYANMQSYGQTNGLYIDRRSPSPAVSYENTNGTRVTHSLLPRVHYTGTTRSPRPQPRSTKTIKRVH